MKKYLMLLAGLFISLSAFNQSVISIDEARQQGSGNVTVRGIVTNGPELGSIRYIQDETGGIAAYGSSLSGLVPGDEVTITGSLSDYNNLLEISPVTDVTVNSQDNPLPDPVVLTPSELGEQYEAQLVQVHNAVFEDGGQFAGKTNYKFVANGVQGEVRINDAASPLVNLPIPTGEVTITGPLAQYQSIYQILPRTGEDINPESSINLTSLLSLSDLSQTGFTISWDTDVEGTTEAFVGNTPDLEDGAITGTGSGTSHSITIDGASPSELFYIQAFSVLGEDTAKTPVSVFITQSESSGDMKAYFTGTVDNSVSTGRDAVQLDNAIDDTLIAYINRAQYSIDFTIYNFNNSGISDISAALNAAYARGVDVRLIYDSNTDAIGVNSLDAGIGKIASPESNYPDYGIMHNKFVVFDAESLNPDDPIVWTGATNFTDGQINTDPNNVIIIQDKSLAIAYRLEFNEMFGTDGEVPDPQNSRFGPDKTDNTPHQFIIGGKRVEAYFSPSDGTNGKILETIETADQNISVATMLITRTDLGYALADKQTEENVETKVLVNVEENCYEPVVNALQRALAQDFRESGEAGIMHHKYMIVDEGQTDSDPVLLTGSHNWSSSAELRNDENTLIIHDAEMANVYYQNFMARFSKGLLIIDAPVLSNDYVTMDEGASITINVTDNDEIPSAYTLEITGNPANGTASLESDNSIIYTPDAGFNNNLDTISYEVCLTDNAELCDSAIAVVLVQKPVSVSENELFEARVYPNPTYGYINVWVEDRDIEINAVSVTDLTGRTLIHRTDVYPGYPYRFDTSDMKAGVYFVRIDTNKGILNRKVIVRK